MPHLTCATTTQEIEFEIDIIELVYEHVDSVDDLEELLQGISSHTVEQYADRLKVTAKEELYNNITCVDELTELMGNVDDSVVEDYRQSIIDERLKEQPADLIDATCSATNDELQDVLVCVLNQHPRSLHRFLVSKQLEVKLAMIESAQAILADLDDYF